MQADIPGWGSTNAGMDWNGMDYWNGLQGSNSQLFFHTLSNRVSIASHTAMKMHSKIVLEGSCVRIVLKLFSSLYVHAKFEKAAPVTIEMFDQVKLTTSTKVWSTCDYRRCTEVY